MDKNIRAILFDSGRVLNYPQSGNWFITPNFFKYVDKNVFNSIPRDKRKLAFKRAYDYINSCKLIKTQEEEYVHFIEYYNIFFKKLPELNLKTDYSGSVVKTKIIDIYNEPYFFHVTGLSYNF